MHLLYILSGAGSAMHNCLIMGSGRSGTSMVAGTLAGAGYFMGEQLYKPRASNPKGFYEDVEVNAINEAILASVMPWVPSHFRPGRLYTLLRRILFPGKPGVGERWLARVPLDISLGSTPEIDARIQRLLQNKVYCLKDPRFCYTLPLWRPWLEQTRFICIFRDPTITAASMLSELRAVPKLTPLKLTYADCLETWRLMYSHVLDIHCRQGEWLFVHYDQVLDGTALDRLGAFLEVTPDRTFPDPILQRTQPDGEMPEPIYWIYKKLCDQADYSREIR